MSKKSSRRPPKQPTVKQAVINPDAAGIDLACEVQDCQWLQFLHSVGLLHASFRPAIEVCAVRTLLRHRDSLVQEEKEERDTEGFQKSCGLGRSLLRLFANRQPRVGLPQPRIKLVLEPPDNFRVLLR
jgi:hypothetical protein